MSTAGNQARLFLTLVVFASFVWTVTDADLGWHLRYGDHFWQFGSLLTENTFSWSLPDYQWTNHSWGYDLIISRLYNWGGFTLLSLFGATLTAGAFFIMLPKATSLLVAVPATAFFILINQALLNTGLKSTYISIFLTACLLKLLAAAADRPKPSYAIYLFGLFVIWSNLHGQFLLGLIFLSLFSLYFVFKNRHRWYWLILMTTSLTATLMNPWGFNLWSTAIHHGNAKTLPAIFEWMPWEWHQPLTIILAGSMLTLLFLMRQKRLRLSVPAILIFCASMLLALRARRLIPIYTLISLPLFINSLEPLVAKLKPSRRQQFQFLGIIGLCGLVLMQMPRIKNLTSQSWSTYCNSHVTCSDAAAMFIYSHPPQGPIFNAYSLGGHLIYRVPDVPVYIDGRMTLWQDRAGDYPFLTYLSIIHHQQNSLLWLHHHHIHYVILQPQFALATVLQENQWPLIFYDERVAIFENPHYRQDN
jgi:hypothetical protein